MPTFEERKTKRWKDQLFLTDTLIKNSYHDQECEASSLPRQVQLSPLPIKEASFSSSQRASQRSSARSECRGRLLTEVSSPKRHIHTQSLYLRLKENCWEEVHKVHRVRGPESLLQRYERKVVLMKSQHYGFLRSQHHQLTCWHWRTTKNSRQRMLLRRHGEGLWGPPPPFTGYPISCRQPKIHVHSCNTK